jgi:hypothetical protein
MKTCHPERSEGSHPLCSPQGIIRPDKSGLRMTI